MQWLQQSSPIPRWIKAAAGLVLVIFAGLLVLTLVRWPYRKAEVAKALQEGFISKIDVAHYHLIFFPRPGFVAEGLVFHRHGAQDIPPIATVRKLTAYSSYATLLFAPSRFEEMRVEGLRITAPPRGTKAEEIDKDETGAEAKGSRCVVEHLIADGAELQFGRQNQEPLRFVFTRLRLSHLAAKQVLGYSVTLIEPFMKGTVEANGKLGPPRRRDVGNMPVSGTYRYSGAQLNNFSALSGVLSAKGQFAGPFAQIRAEGEVNAPDFRVENNHPIGLNTAFKAVIDGTKGDVSLTPATAAFERTTITSEGTIAGDPKLTSMNLSVRGGHIQDLLAIFLKRIPPMNGIISFRAKALLPSSTAPFLKKVRLDGDFGIGDGRFTNPATEHKIDEFSERAKNEHPPKDDPDPPVAISNLKGHVSLRGGVATFSHVSFAVPGATALLSGTYRLEDHRVDLAGDLHMDQDVSHSTTGMKSLLLKPLIPFFKKKHGSVLPIHITGTSEDPVIAANLMGRKNPPKGPAS